MLHVIMCIIVLAFLAFAAHTRGEYVWCLMPFLSLIAGIFAIAIIIGAYFGITKISNGNKIIQCILFIILGGLCVWLQWKLDDKK